MKSFSETIGDMRMFRKTRPLNASYTRYFAVCFLVVIVYVTHLNTSRTSTKKVLDFKELPSRIFNSNNGSDVKTNQTEQTLNLTIRERLRNCTDDFRNSHLMTVEYPGRTGNHLFRFATLLAVTELTCYKPVRRLAPLSLDAIFDLQNVEKFNGTFRTITEPGWGIYDPDITSKISPDSNWTLGGFRQSYRYFQNHSEFVRSSFRFKDNIKKDVNEFLSQEMLTGKPRVCIHVRRGDMVKVTPKDGRMVAGIDFINKAVAHMKNYLKPSKFVLIVVSDDTNWCYRHIKGEYVFISPFKDVGRDLYLLTQCDHNIVTCGTFGWMGAWLNETGVVIYYKRFPVPKSILSRRFKRDDYYPNHWIGI